MKHEEFMQKYGIQSSFNDLSPHEQFMHNQKIKEQKEEEERLRLEEENKRKEAERRQQEIEAARLTEELPFEEAKEAIIQHESKGDKDAIFVNKDGSEDIGLYQINERWVNKNATKDGLPSYSVAADGTVDAVYAAIDSTISENIPQWSTTDDDGRKLMLRVPEINEMVANIIYDARGVNQWSSADRVKDTLQTNIRNQSVDNMVSDAFSGNSPTLDDIRERINLEPTTAAAESTVIEIDERTDEEKWQDRLAEAEKPKNVLDGIQKYLGDPIRLVPFLNTSSDIKEVVDLKNIMDRIDTATKENVEPNREDMLKLYEYQLNNQSEKDFGYKVATVLGELPAFAFEIGLTGGIYSAGKKATLEAGKFAVKKVLGKEMRESVAKYVTKHGLLDKSVKFGAKSVAAISGATMQTVANEGIKELGAWATDDWLPGGRIRLGMEEHMMGNLPISMDERGDLQAAVFEEGDGFNEAFAKSATDFWIEMVSERSGGAFNAIGSMGRKWAAKQGILKKFLELNPTKKVKDFNKLIKRYGWNGVLEEMGEERIGEAARGVAYELGIEDEGFKYKLPSWNQLAVEFVAFLIPGVTIAGIRGSLGKTGDNNDPVPEFDLTDPAELKKAVKAKGITVEVVENDGVYDVNTYIGESLIDQSTGYEDKKSADTVAESLEKEYVHFVNAKDVTTEEADQLELELKEKEEKPDYNKMKVASLKEELKNRDLSRAGLKADLVARLEEADKEVAPVEEVVEEEVPVEEVTEEVAEEVVEEAPTIEDFKAGVKEITDDIDLETLAIATADMTKEDQEDMRERITSGKRDNMFTPYNIGEKRYDSSEDKERGIGEIITQEASDAAKLKILSALKEEAPDIKQQDFDTRVNTEVSEDEQAEVHVDDIRNAKGTPLAWVKNIKTNSVNELKKSAKKLQNYIDKNQDSDNDSVIDNVNMADEAIESIKTVLQNRNLDLNDDLNIVDLGVEEVVVEETPATEVVTKETPQLNPQLKKALIRTYGKDYENNQEYQEYLDEKDLVDILELDEEGQKDLQADLTVKDVGKTFSAGIFPGITQESLELLGNTIIGAGRFTYENLPKFVQNQAKNLGVTTDNFKQKWDEYAANPNKAPQQMKAFMKKVFTHMKKWYGKGRDAVVEYIKNPKIGLGIEIVGGISQEIKKIPESTLNNIVKLIKENIAVGMAHPERAGDIDQILTGQDIGAGWGGKFADKSDIAVDQELKKLFPNTTVRKNVINYIEKKFISDKEMAELDAYSVADFLPQAVEDMAEKQKMAKMTQKELAAYKAGKQRGQMKVVGVEAKAERPLAPTPINFNTPINTKKKSDTVYTYIFDKGANKAQFIKDYMSVMPNKKARGNLTRGEYRANLGKMYDSGKKAYKKAIKNLANKTQTKQGLKETFESGKHMMDWYDGFFPYIQKKFGKDAGLVADFIAITSAGAQLNANITLGLKAYTQYKLGEEVRAGRFFTDKPSGEALKRNIANAISNHEKGTSLKIGDRKITNFSKALKGDPNAVVLDVWMGRVFGFDMDKKTALNESEYRKYEQIVKELAFQGGKTPRQFQASVWFGIREGHSPMHKGDPGLDSVTYEQLLEKAIPNFTYTDKKGEKRSLKQLDKDGIVYLNGSFGLTPEMLDTIGKALVDTGKYAFDVLSPAMQKMGNRLGVTAQNFKLRFAQFKNNAKEMTDATKKWFKKVVGHMKGWFKNNSKNLADSKPVEKVNKRMEKIVTPEVIPEGEDLLANIRKAIEAAEAEVRAKGGKQRKPSQKPYWKKVREGKIQPKVGKGDNVAGGFGQAFWSLSGRLKKVKGGMGVLRALRKFEQHVLTAESDLKRAEPWFKFMQKIMPYRTATVKVGKFKKTIVVPKPLKNKYKEDWLQLEQALLKGDTQAILEVVDKHNAREAYDSMHKMLDDIYYRAVNLTPKEKKEYDKLIAKLAKSRENVPNKNWGVNKIKVWLTEKDIKYKKTKIVDGKRKGVNKEDLLNIASNSSTGMKKKMDNLEKDETRFAKLNKKMIYNFPYWGDDASVYFPRTVEDPMAYHGFLTNPENPKISPGEMNKIEEALASKYGFKKGEEIPPDILAQAMDVYLKSGGASIVGGRPGATKGRIIEAKTSEGITDDMVPYYADPITSLLGYIHRMNESIAKQKLFGKGVDIDNPNNAEHVGAFVAGLVTGENEYGVKIDRKDQEEIKDVFNARFANGWGRYKSTIQAIKNTTYMTSLVDIFTTMIQFGDLFTGAVYRGRTNPIILTKAIGRAFAGQIPGLNKLIRSPIDARDYGLVRISAEFTNNAEFLGKALSRAFKYSGFAAADRIGKEALINTVIAKAQKEAKKGKLSLATQELINDAFGKDSKKAKEVVEQLKAGKINDDIISLAYWTLLEHQPVAESELPALYSRSAGARLFYQLKTWQLKQLSLWRSETKGMWDKGHKAQAIRNGIYMTSALAMAGASPDAIRDFFQGRPMHFKDFVSENLWRLFTISKYSAEKLAIGKVEEFAGSLLPTTRIVSSVVKDVNYLNKWLKWARDPFNEDSPEETPKYAWHSLNLIPLIGKQLYTGLPFPSIPNSMKELKEMMAGVPDSENGRLIEGWRGKKQILIRQRDYYKELEEELWKKGEMLSDFDMQLQMKAEMELSNLELQESLDRMWWEDKVDKIARATGLRAP